MGGRLFTDKLVFRWLEGYGAWSLDSATPVILAYPAHASGSSLTMEEVALGTWVYTFQESC